MKKLKITKSKTVIETIKYHLTDEIKYVKTITNGKETNRELTYTGKKIGGYDIYPVYDKDLSILKKHNPCWGDKKKSGNWFIKETLPEPENIDLKKIIYIQYATHEFFDLNKEPIPVVIHGDYITGYLNDYFYDLEKLKKYLDKHPYVVECSEIKNVPYFNEGDNCGYRYLDVLVLPTKQFLKKHNDCASPKEIVFYKPYQKNSVDFLKIKKFAIRDKYYY